MKMYILFTLKNFDVSLVSEDFLSTEFQSVHEPFSDGSSIGHYDWLKQSSGEVIGVRLWHFNDNDSQTDLILNEFCKSDHVVPFEEKQISFFFKKERMSFDEDLSQHQELFGCGTLNGKNGDKIIYFYANSLFHERAMVPLASR